MKILSFISFLFFISCTSKEDVQRYEPTIIANVELREKALPQKKVSKDIITHSKRFKSLNQILNYAAKVDSFTTFTSYPFSYFISGDLLNNKRKSAVLVTCLENSKNCFKLYYYEVVRNKWKLYDSVSRLQVNEMQFDLRFEDYNFDGINDIFLRSSMNIDYSKEMGHLITIDYSKRKMKMHPEMSFASNIKADTINKFLTADEAKEGDTFPLYYNRVYRWKNDTLLKGELRKINL